MRYIIGIVITARVDEIMVIAAPGFVSPPYAAGKIMVLSPKGAAKAKMVRVIISSLTFRSIRIRVIMPGITISLNRERI